LHTVPAAEIFRRFGAGVKSGDALRYIAHQPPVQTAPPRQAVENPVLIEAVHLHQPVDGLAAAVNGKSAVRLPGDGGDAPVKVRRRAPVDRNFRLASPAALVGRGKIQIGENDRALELENPLRPEKNQRNMSFDFLRRPRTNGPGAGEEFDNVTLIGGGYGPVPSSNDQSSFNGLPSSRKTT
jgi:hypothetical protein